MADNIKIIGNITSTTTINRYSEEDVNLLQSSKLQENFGGTNDYIEYYIYDIGGNLLNTNYNYLDYKLPPTTGLTPSTSTFPNTTGNIQTTDVGILSTLATPTSSLYPTIEIDPIQDLQNLGYSSGEFSIRYNLFQNTLSNYIDSALFVKEISQDRTEIRLASITLSDNEIEQVTLSLIDKINNSTYYVDYLLNFGNNEQYVAVNVALNRVPEGYEILFKLYEPLPLSVQEKQTLWVVEEKVSPYLFDINLDKLITPPPPPTLRGPNFNISINNNQGTVASSYQTYQSLVDGLQSLQNNSYKQILNLLATQSANINVDYTDFNNFVFFGSAFKRVSNFYEKVKEIENYNNFINTKSSLTSSTPSLILEINQYSSSINDIVSKFDGYENYLYFESSSYTWPKSGSLKPYSLLSTGSATVNTWYNALTGSTQDYDSENYNNLEYAIPVFLKDDKENQPFLTFLNMVGQYFDNIWIYLQAITDINLANNNLNYGISRDLVYPQLLSLGLKLYNSQAGEDVDQYLVGANTGSSTWDNNTTITGSYLNNVPRKDLVSELYKRIYHNLPLLMKQKGTVEGLNNLMTIFGIPNRDYYTLTSGSIQTTWYTPTGSSVTSSILNVKEYGGDLKSNLIKGYNDDKVRIVNNSIISNTIYSGSILSPVLSLQTFPITSSQFRENDMHYVDISFSPQNQINTYISGAVTSNNPTWSLDDFIGDPGYLYSSSYSSLDAQRKLYFETGTPTSLPFTASLLDYNKFIRLVEYFDNALFKMLADFVPERASLSTGVTINSPVLERNKVAYANPTNSTTQSVPTAEYSASGISSTYGTFYNALSSSNNTMGWYDGELSGSIVNINQYFLDNNNPYLGRKLQGSCKTVTFNGGTTGTIFSGIFFICGASTPTNGLNISANSTISQCVDLSRSFTIKVTSGNGFIDFTGNICASGSFIADDTNAFQHSDWNVLLNNVSSSVLSSTRKDIEYIYGTTGSITYPAELQDSYLSLRSYNTSRYEGCKVTSQLYNTYTDGDDSYGKTAAIDRNVRKIGLFTQIETSSFLLKRNNVALKYLVDEFGNLTELNQLNKNWWDIQRTFIMGDTGSVALFDNKKFSNQKSTDGKKLIFDSGYLYTPVFYSNRDSRSYFENISDLSSYLAQADNTQNLGDHSINTGSNQFTNLFNNVIQGTEYMTGGSGTNLPIYNVQEAGAHKINAAVNISITTVPGTYGTVTFKLSVFKGISGATLIQDQTLTATLAAATATAYTSSQFWIADTSTSTNITQFGTPVTAAQPILIGGNYYTQFYRYSGYTNDCLTISTGLLYSLNSSINFTKNTSCSPVGYKAGFFSLYSIPDINRSLSGTTLSFNIDIPTISLVNSDDIEAKLEYVSNTGANFKPSEYSGGQLTTYISRGNFSVSGLSTLEGNYPYVPSPYFNPYAYSLTGSLLLLSSELGNFYSPNYIFLPTYTSGSNVYTSSMYSQWGDVDYPFQLQPYDIFVAYDTSGSYYEYRILSIDTSQSPNVYINLDNPIPASLRANLTSTAPNVAKFLFLKRIEDETNLHLNFTKRRGSTSYGFLIPENLAPDVLANIDTITKQVKQKLLADQQGTTL
jgi:hypothetical protein